MLQFGAAVRWARDDVVHKAQHCIRFPVISELACFNIGLCQPTPSLCFNVIRELPRYKCKRFSSVAWEPSQHFRQADSNVDRVAPSKALIPPATIGLGFGESLLPAAPLYRRIEAGLSSTQQAERFRGRLCMNLRVSNMDGKKGRSI